MRAHQTFFVLLFTGVMIVAPQTGSAARSSRGVTKVEKSYFSVNGELFHLTQRKNSDGVVIEQVLLSDNRIQIAFDHDGDGTWDSWESQTPSRRILFTEPENGHFTLMKAEYVTEKGVVHLRFVRKKDGQFHLYWRSLNPNKSLMKATLKAPEDIVVGCRIAEMGLQEDAAAINEELAKSDASRSAILDTIFDRIIDNSCKTPDWAGTKVDPKNPLLSGIFDVFNSDHEFNADKLNELKNTGSPSRIGKPTKKEQPMYLACLREYGLYTHAARISSALHSYVRSAKPFEWKITCRDATGKDPTGIKGLYQYRTGAPPYITFIRDRRGGDDKIDKKKEDFAATFFHEMLHYSLIQDEDVVHTIEACCTQTDPNTHECEELRLYSNRRIVAQKVDKVIAEKIPPEVLRTLSLIVEDAYGENPDKKYEAFINQVVLAREVVLLSDECGEDGDGIEHPERLNPNINPTCNKAFKDQLDKLTSYMFSREQCINSAAKDMPRLADRQEYCDYLFEYMRQLVVGIDAKKLEEAGICRDKKKEENTPSSQSWLPWRLWFSSIGFAESSDQLTKKLGELCIIGKTKIEWSGMATETGAPRDNIAGVDPLTGLPFTEAQKAPSSDSIGGAIDYAGSIGDVNSGTTSGSKGGTSSGSEVITSKPHRNEGNVSKREPTRFPKTASEDTMGPPTFDYSRPSERAQKISESLRFERETESRIESIKKYVEAAYNQVVPEARARSRSSGGDKALTDVPSNSLKVPDPFAGSFRSPASLATNAKLKGTRTASSNPDDRPSRSTAASLRNAAGGGRVGASGVQSSKISASPAAGLGRGVAGLSRTGASPSPSQSNKAKKKEVDRRALNAFLKYMQNIDRRLMKLELRRSSVRRSLDNFRVAVIDDEGQYHGPVETAEYWLVFNHQKQRLELMTEDASR